MSIFPSAHIVLFPFLFVLTLPIAVFASITTLFAFSILSIRVTFVYIELALAIIPHYLLGPRSSSKPDHDLLKAAAAAASYSPTLSTTRRNKKRRTSSSSNISGTGAITPENLLGISQSVGITRDFEGVGGWRLDSGETDEEVLWTSINSRLELPADHGRRHHRRSLTSGSLPGERRGTRTGSPEEKIMNTSKARTPPVGKSGNGEYFPAQKVLSRNGPGATGSNIKVTNSGSSGSSKGSSGLYMRR